MKRPSQAKEDINLRIIQLLRADGRISNKDIAQQLGISEPTIAARIRTMQAQNIIRITAQHSVLHPGSAGMVAIVEFYVNSPASIDAVSEAVAGFEEVITAYRTSRRPEIIAHCRAPDPRALTVTLQKMASQIPDLSQMVTLPILELALFRSDYGALHGAASKETGQKDINEKLIALLQEDGRQTSRSLAQKLGLSETAVRQRLAKLRNDPGIRIGLVVDAQALNISVWNDLRITIKPALLGAAMAKLAKQDNLSMVAHIAGPANLALFCVERSYEDFDRFIKDHIRTLDGIEDFTVMRVPEVIRHDYNYSL